MWPSSSSTESGTQQCGPSKNVSKASCLVKGNHFSVCCSCSSSSCALVSVTLQAPTRTGVSRITSVHTHWCQSHYKRPHALVSVALQTSTRTGVSRITSVHTHWCQSHYKRPHTHWCQSHYKRPHALVSVTLQASTHTLQKTGCQIHNNSN